MKLWDDKRRVNAQVLIKKLLPTRPGGGWSFRTVTEITFSELISSANQQLSRIEAMLTLKAMSDSGMGEIEDFERLLFEARKKARRRREAEWRFYLPFAIDRQSEFGGRSFAVLDKRIRVLSWPTVISRAGIRDARPAAIGERVGRQIREIPQFFLCMESTGRGWGEAWQRLSAAFDTFRGVVEFTLNFGGWGFRSYPQPRATIPHPPWMLARSGRAGELEYIHFWSDEPGPGARPYKLEARTITILKKNLRVFRREPAADSTLSLIADCLRLYAQAMDTQWPYQCFLGFWQLAEAIALSEEIGGDTDKVVDRLAWHGTRVGLPGSGYRYSLARFAKKRNEIVHRGIHSVGDGDVNILKVATEAALSWLFYASKSLPSKRHLREFYRLRDISPADLGAVRDASKWVESMRQKRKDGAARTRKGSQRQGEKGRGD